MTCATQLFRVEFYYLNVGIILLASNMGSELCREILDGSYFVHVRVNNTGRTIDHYNYWEDEEADARSKDS